MFGPDSWQREHRRLMRHAVNACWGRHQDAEDAVSEVVYHYMVRVKAGKLIDHPLWYLIHAIKNAAREQRRRRPTFSLTPDMSIEDETISGAVDRLDKEAQIKRLKRYKDGRFLLEFYRTLRPSGAMRIAATRARRRLRKAFA